MSSGEYLTEKKVSWNGVKVGLAIWVFALVALLLTENLVDLPAIAAKADDFDVRRAEPATTDILPDKEYNLLNCLYCE